MYMHLHVWSLARLGLHVLHWSLHKPCNSKWNKSRLAQATPVKLATLEALPLTTGLRHLHIYLGNYCPQEWAQLFSQATHFRWAQTSTCHSSPLLNTFFSCKVTKLYSTSTKLQVLLYPRNSLCWTSNSPRLITSKWHENSITATLSKPLPNLYKSHHYCSVIAFQNIIMTKCYSFWEYTQGIWLCGPDRSGTTVWAREYLEPGPLLALLSEGLLAPLPSPPSNNYILTA